MLEERLKKLTPAALKHILVGDTLHYKSGEELDFSEAEVTVIKSFANGCIVRVEKIIPTGKKSGLEIGQEIIALWDSLWG